MNNESERKRNSGLHVTLSTKGSENRVYVNRRDGGGVLKIQALNVRHKCVRLEISADESYQGRGVNRVTLLPGEGRDRININGNDGVEALKIQALDVKGRYVELGIRADESYLIRRVKLIPPEEILQLERTLEYGN